MICLSYATKPQPTSTAMTTPPKPAKKGKPYHSTLAPFATDIFRWQQEGKTYQDIADLLAEKGVIIHRTTIWHWVSIRAKGRGRRIMLPDPSLPPVILPSTTTPLHSPASTPPPSPPPKPQQQQQPRDVGGKILKNAQYAPPPDADTL